MNRLFASISVLFFASLSSTEYLYPVGHMYKEGEKLLLMYQKSVHHVELWQWDPVTQETRQALLSSYTPAGVALLPNGKGFSFIDNDTLHVAESHKRSPALIPLYEPLYDFTRMRWLDEEHCIISAKEKEQYGIYIIDRQGQCYQVLRNAISHYKYPAVIEDTLFYIEIAGDLHSIKQTTLDLRPLYTPKQITAEDLYALSNERLFCQTSEPDILMECKNRSIAFLTMKDPEHGFYVEHPSRIDRHATRITFDYFSCTKIHNTWHEKHLFTFSLPMAYLMSTEERMYESIMPFLPTLKDNFSLYYFDCKEGTITTQLWHYNILTEEGTQLTQAPQSALGAYIYKNSVWYGGVLQDQDLPNAAIPSLWVNDLGQLCVNLPKLY